MRNLLHASNLQGLKAMPKIEGAIMKSTSLSFDTLREGNTTRLPLFKNRHGAPAHSKPDGSDWSLSEWVNAAAGEHGELTELVLIAAITKSFGTIANMTKKLQRGDHTLKELRPLIAKEIADIVTYCDLLAFRAGIDLGEAVMLKFNEVSQRVGCDVLIDEYGVYRALSGARGGRQGGLITNTAKCDGNHGGPPCNDPECWSREPDEVKKFNATYDENARRRGQYDEQK